MIGQTLIDYLRNDGAMGDDREAYDNLMQAEQGEARSIGTIELEMKRRHRKMMLKKMMQDAGFADLAKIAQPVERQITYDPNDI